MAAGLELDNLSGPLQLKPFYDSVISTGISTGWGMKELRAALPRRAGCNPEGPGQAAEVGLCEPHEVQQGQGQAPAPG